MPGDVLPSGEGVILCPERDFSHETEPILLLPSTRLFRHKIYEMKLVVPVAWRMEKHLSSQSISLAGARAVCCRSGTAQEIKCPKCGQVITVSSKADEPALIDVPLDDSVPTGRVAPQMPGTPLREVYQYRLQTLCSSSAQHLESSLMIMVNLGGNLISSMAFDLMARCRDPLPSHTAASSSSSVGQDLKPRSVSKNYLSAEALARAIGTGPVQPFDAAGGVFINAVAGSAGHSTSKRRGKKTAPVEQQQPETVAQEIPAEDLLPVPQQQPVAPTLPANIQAAFAPQPVLVATSTLSPTSALAITGSPPNSVAHEVPVSPHGVVRIHVSTQPGAGIPVAPAQEVPKQQPSSPEEKTVTLPVTTLEAPRKGPIQTPIGTYILNKALDTDEDGMKLRRVVEEALLVLAQLDMQSGAPAPPRRIIRVLKTAGEVTPDMFLEALEHAVLPLVKQVAGTKPLVSHFARGELIVMVSCYNSVYEAVVTNEISMKFGRNQMPIPNPVNRDVIGRGEVEQVFFGYNW